MQIKTIRKTIFSASEFDDEVNKALDAGWRLTRREVLQGEGKEKTCYDNWLLYAELVKMDPVPEQPAMDPLEAIQVLARACENAPQCEPESCPLHDWCTTLGNDPVPKDWKQAPKRQ